MLITIDVGNTKTDVGWYAGDKLAGRRSFNTNKHATSDEIELALSAVANDGCFSVADVQAVCVSCVVPEIYRTLPKAVKKIADAQNTKIEYCFINANSAEGLNKQIYDVAFPAKDEVGADYIAAVIGAKAKIDGACIVADMGTATNLAIINEDGQFYSGIIYPGVETGIRALLGSASALSDYRIKEPDVVCGKNTKECLNSGFIFGEAARLDGIVQRIWDEQGYKCPIITTGG